MGTTDTATFCATMVDEWARAGMTLACVAPGSRSTPLALALVADGRLRVELFHDERAAAFAALGHGVATGQPAVVLCTSGTAAAHFHAAVIEADLSSVPLLVCTADRPPELWDVGAPQTVDQTHLYGSAVRFFAEPGPPDEAAAASWRSLASRAVTEATGWSGRPGPVHLNLSFRDPLVGDPGELPPGRADGRPWHRVASTRGLDEADDRLTPPPPLHRDRQAVHGVNLDRADDRLTLLPPLHRGGQAVNGVIVAGAGTPGPEAVGALAEALGWPVLADHRSGCRAGPQAIAHADALLRSTAFAESIRPEVALRFGEALASKVLGQWLASGPGEQVSIVDGTRWSDPDRQAASVLSGPGIAAALLDLLPTDLEPSNAADRWRHADALAATTIASVLAAAGHPDERPTTAGPTPSGTTGRPDERPTTPGPTPSGTTGRPDERPTTAGPTPSGTTGRPDERAGGGDAEGGEGVAGTSDSERAGVGVTEIGVAREVVASLPAGAALVVASSMPVRDVEWFAPNRNDIEVYANRGANGIDGVLATAIGVATGGRPTTVLLGDVALLHDSTALIGLRDRALDLHIVVIDNDGGGIFSFLPQHELLPAGTYELLFGTPHGTDLAALLAAHRLSVRTWPDLGPVPRGVSITIARTDRAANAALHDRVNRAVVKALES